MDGSHPLLYPSPLSPRQEIGWWEDGRRELTNGWGKDKRKKKVGECCIINCHSTGAYVCLTFYLVLSIITSDEAVVAGTKKVVETRPGHERSAFSIITLAIYIHMYVSHPIS